MRRAAPSIHQRVVDELELRPQYVGAIEDIPAAGPVVIVANHPFGIIEGPVLGALFDRIRNDMMFVTNSLLAELPELAPRIIAVNPFGAASHANSSAIRAALRHLSSGGALVVFPAGQVSSVRLPLGRVLDSEWQPMAARLAIKTGARILPVFFQGRNSAGFQLAGLVHPALRTMLLPGQMLARRRQTVRVAIGQAVSPDRFRDAARLTAFLRARTYALSALFRQSAVAPPLPLDSLCLEISRLSPILSSGPFDVFLQKAVDIPNALPEIGRLRELTFRAVGEGTGASSDIDAFDRHYWHLFLWHREHRQIAGAYRLADRECLPAGTGFYTATLFSFPRNWSTLASQAVELGRSFVLPRYQRDFLPLMLLWKGIGVFVRNRPHLRYLFGPVSVSSDYSTASRTAIATHFSAWPKGYRPRNPLTHALARWPGVQRHRNTEELDAHIASLEPDGKGLPVLLRQYLNLGGEILCLNVDPRFSNTLDGLVLLDLAKTPPRLLARYFGPEAAERFQR